MNPMIKSFNEDGGDKMSSSDVNSKIDLVDSPKQIKKKIGKAFCAEKDITSGLFQFFEKVIYKIIRDNNRKVEFNRPKKNMGET